MVIDSQIDVRKHVVTIFKDGDWRAWGAMDAHLAEPTSVFVHIGLEEIAGAIKDDAQRLKAGRG